MKYPVIILTFYVFLLHQSEGKQPRFGSKFKDILSRLDNILYDVKDLAKDSVKDWFPPLLFDHSHHNVSHRNHSLHRGGRNMRKWKPWTKLNQNRTRIGSGSWGRGNSTRKSGGRNSTRVSWGRKNRWHRNSTRVPFGRRNRWRRRNATHHDNSNKNTGWKNWWNNNVPDFWGSNSTYEETNSTLWEKNSTFATPKPWQPETFGNHSGWNRNRTNERKPKEAIILAKCDSTKSDRKCRINGFKRFQSSEDCEDTYEFCSDKTVINKYRNECRRNGFLSKNCKKSCHKCHTGGFLRAAPSNRITNKTRTSIIRIHIDRRAFKDKDGNLRYECEGESNVSVCLPIVYRRKPLKMGSDTREGSVIKICTKVNRNETDCDELEEDEESHKDWNLAFEEITIPCDAKSDILVKVERGGDAVDIREVSLYDDKCKEVEDYDDFGDDDGDDDDDDDYDDGNIYF